MTAINPGLQADTEIRHDPNRRVAIAVSAINVRRLLPGLRSLVEQGRDFWLVDIYRPLPDLKRLLTEWKPAGLITEWIPGISEEITSWLHPCVVATSRIQKPGIYGIDIDNEAIGRKAAEYFLLHRWPHIAFYGNNTPYSRERENGFAQTLTSHNLSYHRLCDNEGWSRQYIEHWHESDEVVVHWLRELPKPVAIFCAHDPSGRSLAEACRDIGLQVPEQVAILGVNNDELVCNMSHPPLSSIHIPWDQLGFAAGRLMEQLLINKTIKPNQPAPLITPGEVIERRSTELLAVEDPRLGRALAWIRDNACSGIQVSDVVHHLHISRRNLENLFRSHLARSPRDEIIRIRIDRAKKLLQQTNLTLPDIAERCGFSTPERFSLNFKAYTKNTPAAWRKQTRLR